MQNQSRCCLRDLLPILEARGNCCDKIDKVLKYCQTHMKHEITEPGPPPPVPPSRDTDRERHDA